MRASEVLSGISSVKVEELQSYVSEKLSGITSIDRMEVGLNPIKTCIELVATKKAAAMLRELLADFMGYSPNETRKIDPKDSFQV
jgi:hypothetical protein